MFSVGDFNIGYRSRTGIPSIKATGITHTEDFDYTPNNVADAFYQRGWIVELVFAQHRYVVAVYTHEARSDLGAHTLALFRARCYVDDLGDLISSRVAPDADEYRTSFGVDGAAFAIRTEHSDEWRNAA